MKQLILASGSIQRKKLLQMLGLKFRVVRSNAPEVENISSSCAALVKHNALLKAREVARRYKNSVIIGADTVVFIGNKQMVLKPKNYADAKRILKILFSRPQWVYTGVAIIDTAENKTYIDYEKTKVFMTRLTDKEIDNYHRKVHPFDKAGGFDIEGVGSVFIHRIEGCYTNVIGLPMSKLFRMLKRCGVSALCILFAAMISGCTTEYNLATRQEESLMYSTEKETKIGDKFSEVIEKNYELVHDVDANERVERILDKIVAVSDRSDVVYFIKILDEDELNAVSLPGGYIYVFKGLVDKVENDDQLAGVIAHEVGHITARHAVKRMQASYGAILAQILAVQTDKGDVAAGVGLALNTMFMEYSQQDEYQADQLAVKYMQKAGYDPQQMVAFLKILKEKQEKDPARPYSYWKTHPNLAQRIAITNKEINGKIGFKDYLNIIQADDPTTTQK